MQKPQSEKEEFYEDLERVYRQCPKNNIKIILSDMNAKVGQEQIYILTVGRNSLHQGSNDNGIRMINLAASLNMTISSTWFPHKDIHKATWVFSDGNTRNQIDHFLIDAGHGSDVMDCCSYRGANIDSDHYLVIAKIRARIAVARKEKGER